MNVMLCLVWHNWLDFY